MDTKLFLSAIIKFLIGFVVVGLLIFIPAGTIKFFNGLLFMGLLFIPMFIGGIILFFLDPLLLKNRLNAKEKESEQKEVLFLSGVMFISGFIVKLLVINNKSELNELNIISLVLICVGMFTTIEISPLFDYFYVFPIAWLIIIKILYKKFKKVSRW